MEETEVRDINWSVQITVTVNGESRAIWDLTEEEIEIITNAIKEDNYSGTFCH